MPNNKDSRANRLAHFARLDALAVAAGIEFVAPVAAMSLVAKMAPQTLKAPGRRRGKMLYVPLSTRKDGVDSCIQGFDGLLYTAMCLAEWVVFLHKRYPSD